MILARLKMWAVVIGIVITAFIATWFGGKKSAIAAIKIKTLEARLKAVKEAEDVRNEVEALDRDTLRSRSTVWVRKSKR